MLLNKLAENKGLKNYTNVYQNNGETKFPKKK